MHYLIATRIKMSHHAVIAASVLIILLLCGFFKAIFRFYVAVLCVCRLILRAVNLNIYMLYALDALHL